MPLRLLTHMGKKQEGLQVVLDNEDFFMKHTDGATYIDQRYFRDRYGAYVPWFDLSTGGKTVLNIFYNPQICFSQRECGENACADIKNLTHDQCDVIVDDNPDWHYTSVKEVNS